MSGWIKLHRALADSMIASDPDHLSVWIHLLILANHSDQKKMFNGRAMEVKRGQLIASRKSLSDKTGINESKVQRILKTLESEQQIEQHMNSKYRLISITNWDKYQGGEQQSEQQVNSTRTAGEQQVNTLEECKELENVKKEQKPLWLNEFYDQLWAHYPKKVDKKKSIARLKALINKEEHRDLADQIATHISQKIPVTSKEYWPTLDRFLRDEKWNDEVIDYEASRPANKPMSAVERVASANGLNTDGTPINPGSHQAVVVKDGLNLWP